MEEIKNLMNESLERLQLIENFITLSLRREKIVPSVQKCFQELEITRNLIEEVNAQVCHRLDAMTVEYEELMERMQRQQAIIIAHVKCERQRKHTEAEQAEISNASSKTVTKYMEELQVNQLSQGEPFTPTRMKIRDYKGSPFVKQQKLMEFAYKITSQKFDSIPKYMRGRESLEKLNEFLELTIISCFNDKYSLMHRQRDAVRHPTDMNLWLMYNQQVSYLPGRHFITSGDIARKIGRTIGKELQNRITMLRHIGVLQEQRVSQTVCYIWNL